MSPFSEEETDNGVPDGPKNMPPEVKGAALVLGASGEQGQAVIQGLVSSGKYEPVYGVTRDVTTSGAIEASNLGAMLLEMDPANPESVEKVLLETRAQYIFLVTTTDLPPHSKSFKDAEDKEYDAIITFLDMVVACHIKDKLDRHIVFSTCDNVEAILEESGVTPDSPDYIEPLEDGSIVAHYSGKGRAGEYALDKIKQVPGVKLTLLTLPLLYSTFLTWVIPLPNEGNTQWTISAALGDKPIDMISCHDLAFIVPEIFDEETLYESHNLRASAEKLNMHEVASIFSDIYGKDVIYNPLTPKEMSEESSIPAAKMMAQLCRWLTNEKAVHDTKVTEAVMYPRKPQRFIDWLLTHSDNKAFDSVGLNYDPEPIMVVTVFGATSLEGQSVVKGLLNDTRKSYKVIATSRDITQPKALELKELDPERVTLVQCNFGDIESCKAAVVGADGAFLVTEFLEHDEIDPDEEEAHAKNVIDVCSESKSVRHLVFSTKEDLQEMNRVMKMNLPALEDKTTASGQPVILSQFDGKARAAAYARTKKLSCTFILMPYYAEKIMELLQPEEGGEDGEIIVQVPDQALQIMTMSVEDLGPAVANIFDSYQVYAGREIGLVTDFVTLSEAVETIKETVYTETDAEGNVTTKKVKKKTVETEKWIENRGTVTKDLGQMFSYYSNSEAVKRRRSVADTLKLLPDARPMRKWLEDNKSDASFRQKMGFR